MDRWHVVYTNWGDGEPSDPDGTGGCVSMHADGKWYDDPCDNAYFVPCKQTDGEKNSDVLDIFTYQFILLGFFHYCYSEGKNCLNDKYFKMSSLHSKRNVEFFSKVI